MVPRRCKKIIKILEPQWYAVVPQWSCVLAPKESLRDPLILEYKNKGALRAGELGTLSYQARGQGADFQSDLELPMIRQHAQNEDVEFGEKT